MRHCTRGREKVGHELYRGNVDIRLADKPHRNRCECVLALEFFSPLHHRCRFCDS
jgi:hypothetical protein